MADDQIEDKTERLRKKIETQFKMLDIKKKESTRILPRGKIKELESHTNEIETRDSRLEKKSKKELMLKSDKEINEVN